MTNLPNRSSDAGPEETRPRDWCDWNYEADEYAKAARRTGSVADRIRYTQLAINALGESLTLLLGPEVATQEDAELLVTLAKADLTPEQARALGKVAS